MDTESSLVAFYKVRTLAGRLSAGMKFINDNLRLLVKLSAPVVVPMALAVSLYTVFMYEISRSVPVWTVCVVLFIGIILIGSSLITSLWFVLLEKYQELGYLPAYHLRDLKGLLPAGFKRALGMFLFLIVVYILLTFLFVFLGVWSLYTLFALVPVYVFLLVPLSLYPYVYMLEKKNLINALKETFRMGVRYWGSTFAIILVMGTLMWLAQLVVSLPFGVMAGIQSRAVLASIAGDPAILPFYFSVLMLLLGLVAFCFSYFSSLLLFASLAFQYGSIKAAYRERSQITEEV